MTTRYKKISDWMFIKLNGAIILYGKVKTSSGPQRAYSSKVVRVLGNDGEVTTLSGTVYQLLGPPKQTLFSLSNWSDSLIIEGKLSYMMARLMMNELSAGERCKCMVAYEGFKLLNM